MVTNTQTESLLYKYGLWKTFKEKLTPIQMVLDFVRLPRNKTLALSVGMPLCY